MNSLEHSQDGEQHGSATDAFRQQIEGLQALAVEKGCHDLTVQSIAAVGERFITERSTVERFVRPTVELVADMSRPDYEAGVRDSEVRIMEQALSAFMNLGADDEAWKRQVWRLGRGPVETVKRWVQLYGLDVSDSLDARMLKNELYEVFNAWGDARLNVITGAVLEAVEAAEVPDTGLTPAETLASLYIPFEAAAHEEYDERFDVSYGEGFEKLAGLETAPRRRRGVWRRIGRAASGGVTGLSPLEQSALQSRDQDVLRAYFRLSHQLSTLNDDLKNRAATLHTEYSHTSGNAEFLGTLAEIRLAMGRAVMSALSHQEVVRFLAPYEEKARRYAGLTESVAVDSEAAAETLEAALAILAAEHAQQVAADGDQQRRYPIGAAATATHGVMRAWPDITGTHMLLLDDDELAGVPKTFNALSGQLWGKEFDANISRTLMLAALEQVHASQTLDPALVFVTTGSRLHPDRATTEEGRTTLLAYCDQIVFLRRHYEAGRFVITYGDEGLIFAMAKAEAAEPKSL